MPPAKQDILSPGHYDADASSIPSVSDSEDDLIHDSRGMLEVNEHDQSVLKDEEETERLLTKPNPFEAVQRVFKSNPHDGKPINTSKRESRRRRREQRTAKRLRQSKFDINGGELVYEMEEGFPYQSSQSSTSSLQLDKKIWEGRHDTKARRHFCRHLLCFHVIIVLLFAILAYGAYEASKNFRKAQTSSTLSNGTHLFAPTTIYISLDGFRADFLNRDLTPTLNKLISEGVSPRYMNPSFPSVTFPNHFTLVTGLYPESHGVVGNTFWDPGLEAEFYYTDPARSMQPEWWMAEPLWVTAEKQGIRTAIHMWPGSEAHIPPIEPTYLDKYNGSEALSRKVDRALSLLDLPGDADSSDESDHRPQFIAFYVPNVDADGHLYGPNSTEIRSTISRVDSMLADLFQGLVDRNLTDVVNVIVVSDHGMATTSNDRLIQLDDLIDLDLVDHIDGWPLRGLRLKNPDRDLQQMYEDLRAQSARSDNFEVYTRQTMPERYHFTNNDRIAPLWVVPKTGWAVVERVDFDVAQAKTDGLVYKPKGLHGYDHEHPLMRAISIMRGPSFPHVPNSRLPIFQNVEMYNIVCDSLGVKPNPNNGTLRLPLKPVGLHDEDVPSADDPPPTNSEGKEVWGLPDDADVPDAAPDASKLTGASSVDDEQSDGSNASDADDETTGWLDYFKDRLEAAKEWANAVIDDLKSKGWQETADSEASGGDKLSGPSHLFEER